MDITINDRTFNIRPLTRGEVKALRKKGYNLSNLTVENADLCMDEVNETVLGDKISEIDAMPNRYAIELFQAIIEETYGAGAAGKNSLSSGDGTAIPTDRTPGRNS